MGRYTENNNGGKGRGSGGHGMALRLILFGVLGIFAMIGFLAVGYTLFNWVSGVDQEARVAAEGAPGEEAGSKQLWTCGMHPQVIQDKPGTCPICRMKLVPLDTDRGKPPSASTPRAERKIKYWWDPMIGPSSISDKPGKSAMGMDLVPVYEDEVSGPEGAGVITIDPVVVQNMGVRVAEVTRGPVRRVIRAVGYLDEAEPLVHDVNLRVSGWIEKLYADTVGESIKKGDRLFELYSPEVQVTAEELITARKALSALPPDADALAHRNRETLVSAARQKLEQYGLGKAMIDRLASMDRAPRTVTFTSPITGHVVEKSVVEGAAVKAGERVMRIVDHSTLWLDAQVYEQDLPLIELGQEVRATVESVPGEIFKGEVIFIHPHVDPATRTATVRASLPNPRMVLRPGMFATAQILVGTGEEKLLAPREAVIDTGVRKVAFVALGEGRFEPREVQTGVAAEDGKVVILKGLSEGDRVVTSGQFLLDAESRMREAIQKHLDERLLAKGEGRNRVPAGAPLSSEMHPYASVPAEGEE